MAAMYPLPARIIASSPLLMRVLAEWLQSNAGGLRWGFG
jgi:hypothetical protein